MIDPVLIAAGTLLLGAAAAVVVAARACGAEAPGRARVLAFCAATSLFACTVSLVCFAPRVALWRAMLVPAGMRTAPEVNRGADVLAQYADAHAPIANVTNRVIRWRVLLPAVARAVRLPGAAYLALAHLACPVVVGLVAWVVWRDTRDRRATVCAALLVATSSWFFVATGWLGYFDSWYVLALVAASFVPSRAGLAAAALLAPWVDERFTIGLPVVLAVRCVHAREVRGVASGFARDALVAAAASAPYLAVRTLGVAGADEESREFARRWVTWDRVAATPAGLWLSGAWHGLRAFWAAAVALLLAPRRALGPRLAVVAAAASTAAVFALVTFDLSRTASALVPAALLGVVLSVRAAPRLARAALLVACALDVTLPARHVVVTFELPPIGGVATETARWRSPPPWLTPPFHEELARVLRARGREAEAREHEEAARALSAR